MNKVSGDQQPRAGVAASSIAVRKSRILLSFCFAVPSTGLSSLRWVASWSSITVEVKPVSLCSLGGN